MKTSGMQSIWRAGRDLIARLGVLLGAALVAGIIFQATTGVFFSVGNFASILLFMTSVAIVGYGQTLVIVAGELDLVAVELQRATQGLTNGPVVVDNVAVKP